jgi:CMP-N-acetylneuraminic acid synthetase
MKILALIPARKGSKRIPNKNSLVLEGIPLIDWTIKTAKSISEISDILISTDDPNLLAIAESQGVLAPWLRPQSLSEDDSLTSDDLDDSDDEVYLSKIADLINNF